ncbi:TonB-dependent receptor [soil metagenome]
MRFTYLLSASVIPVLAVLFPAGAIAQEATPDPTATRVDQVEEIIVTAQRVAQSLQKVPVSVQPVTGAELERRALGDVIQMQTAVPSLQTGTDNTITLRGVGSLVFSPNVDSSVGVAIDEVSLAIPTFMNNFGFEDVSQVEVLLGPQGLLFGRNASAGLLNIVTNRPVIGEYSGRLYGEADYRDTVPGGKDGHIIRGTINVPLSDVAAFRLNAIYSRQDPIAHVVAASPNADVQDYQQRAGAKAKFLFEPNDRFSLYLIGDYARQEGVGGIYDRTYRQFAPGSLVQNFVLADGVTPGPDNLEYGASAPANQKLEGGGVSLKLAYELTDMIAVSNITAYRSYDVLNGADLDFTSFDGVDNNTRTGQYDQFSNELRIALAPGGLIDGQAGLYYFSTRTRSSDSVTGGIFGILGPFDSFNNPLIGTDLNSTVEGDSYAAFGQFNIHPTEQLTLIAGGRFTRDELSIDLLQNQIAYPIPLGVPNVSTQQSTDNDDFSWKLGAQYEVTPDIMSYVTYSKGYKGPAFNDTQAVPNQQLAIGPETVHSLELGLKSFLLDRRLRLNLAAFRSEFEDFQVQGYDPATQSYYTANAANVISQGVEVTAEARPVSGLTLNAAMTFLDSTFDDYATDKCYAGQPNCSPQGTTDSSGNQTPSSAKFTSTIAATYEYPLSSTVNLFVSGDYYHRSALNFASNGNPLTELGAIDVLGFSVGAEINQNVRVAAFCKNCTDERFPVFIGGEPLDATFLNLNSSGQTWGYNSVRTLGLSVSYDF